MDVSIIIVNYNTKDLTLQCLESVYSFTKGLTFEVIVVDNSSNDDSIAKIKQFYPQTKLIESDKNLGFGIANNLGYQNSKGEFIFLLNSDTILINNAIKILWEFLNKHENIAIAGGQLYAKDGLTKVHSYSCVFPSIFMEIDQLFVHSFTKIIEKKRYENIKKNGFFQVAFVTGADMMLRRSDIENIGFFDPLFFLYFEETELAYRYFINGKISVFVPEAKIIHLEGGSFSLSKVRNKHFIDGRNRYYRMNYNTFYHKIANLIWYFNLSVNYIYNYFKSKCHKYNT